MLYKRFGRTELQMPVFSCGGMRYQFKWQDVPLDEIPADQQENLEATIHRAVELGINHIETARGYGTSEMQLGKILPKFFREKLIVQTKVSPVADAKKFREKFEKSLAYLQLDYVDLLGLHGINHAESFDYSLNPGGCLEVAKQLQAEGKVRFIGFSTHGPTNIITKAINTNQFDYVNLHWYYINQWNWSAIEAANRLDMGVFIISPSNKGGLLYQPSEKLVNLCYPLSPMVFNDLFCLSHPQVHTLSIGAAKPQDFDEHLKTLELLDNADKILPPILARLESEAIKTLGEDWVKNWETNLPTWEKTPGQMNIKTVLWLLNLALAYDMIEYSKMRYNLLGNGSSWFPGNKADKLAELDLKECLVNSPQRQKIPQMLAKAHEMLAGAEVKRLSQS
ncbi:aldo/keto reductase [Anabaena cylindrica FACHB-243]|uniref:NADP-dependent oxidoreductase domain protein n=1 Tax=Anabaena cylindrica (strain ATCC 27899 / PCC 7122) TaxID=272123 RepID=K9ZKT2_ANACC|nr:MULTISPECIES: aldo/keto reductase [Anabaena]AFZ59848.1 NADP-dependent oxidoreductase domain protein [Anabaena cylindrica PCC 7122]MBD2417247.1 aldo/keto reductase [Anabaena cylindrica FACHB-243]MBY5280408.1 aldo/keto reductase [Anabaena sp. CCAP 1446/1C]MBY5311662.1 aldo/keto reductase [Anabaena sp. CCAP 1446/1C]MCM2404936.1 aldo/keto reductase [Anabaena sp. CCAP 1446/1C]